MFLLIKREEKPKEIHIDREGRSFWKSKLKTMLIELNGHYLFKHFCNFNK